MPEQSTFTQVLHQWAEVFMHRSFRDFKRFMDDAGLSPSQASTLMQLYHRGACGVSDIGGHAGVSNAAASQLVERMVQMGLLTRAEDPADRRGKQVTLTPGGRTLIESGIEARRKWMEELTTALTPEQQATISAALVTLTEAARRVENNHPQPVGD